jgi:hypothetical protein
MRAMMMITGMEGRYFMIDTDMADPESNLGGVEKAVFDLMSLQCSLVEEVRLGLWVGWVGRGLVAVEEVVY